MPEEKGSTVKLSCYECNIFLSLTTSTPQKMKRIALLCWIFFSCTIWAQTDVLDNVAVLKIVLTKYYSSEKPIVKNRLQLLYFYEEKANNTIEVVEGCKGHPLLKSYINDIKKQVQVADTPENWHKEYDLLFTNQNQYLQQKIQAPVSLSEFQTKTQQFGENNQRLLILNKPIYLSAHYCIIKIGFYRSIEHNSGCFVLLQKRAGVWHWVEEFNRWET